MISQVPARWEGHAWSTFSVARFSELRRKAWTSWGSNLTLKPAFRRERGSRVAGKCGYDIAYSRSLNLELFPRLVRMA